MIRYNHEHPEQVTDGIITTPFHNLSCNGGFKCSPPTGSPVDIDAMKWIADRANTLMVSSTGIRRKPHEQAANEVIRFDYRILYYIKLAAALDLDVIAAAGVRTGADPLGGASVQYWEYLTEHSPLNLTVVNPKVDFTWKFMTPDTDGKIRMGCSSPNSMVSLVANCDRYDIATGNNVGLDRYRIITPDSGLMNPNTFLAVAIDYLSSHHPDWATTTGVGKTLVFPPVIDKAATRLGHKLVEVPAGLRWFVPGLIGGLLGFGGEESAGVSFLDFEDCTWAIDKDGTLLTLLASGILAVTGCSPSQHYAGMESASRTFHYVRADAEASHEQKARLAALSLDDVRVHELARQPITVVLTNAPGSRAPTGGIKVATDSGRSVARPPGTKDKYKIYVESLRDTDHPTQIQAEACEVIDAAFQG